MTGEKKQIDAANDTRVAPKNVVDHADALRSAQRRPCRGPAPRSHGRRQRDGLDLDQRPDDQGHLEEDRRSPSRPSSTTRTGKEVTLTVGQTFVQVITTSTTGYPISFKKGSDTPPATPVPSAVSQLAAVAAALVRPVPRLPTAA